MKFWIEAKDKKFPFLNTLSSSLFFTWFEWHLTLRLPFFHYNSDDNFKVREDLNIYKSKYSRSNQVMKYIYVLIYTQKGRKKRWGKVFKKNHEPIASKNKRRGYFSVHYLKISVSSCDSNDTVNYRTCHDFDLSRKKLKNVWCICKITSFLMDVSAKMCHVSASSQY